MERSQERSHQERSQQSSQKGRGARRGAEGEELRERSQGRGGAKTRAESKSADFPVIFKSFEKKIEIFPRNTEKTPFRGARREKPGEKRGSPRAVQNQKISFLLGFSSHSSQESQYFARNIAKMIQARKERPQSQKVVILLQFYKHSAQNSQYFT